MVYKQSVFCKWIFGLLVPNIILAQPDTLTSLRTAIQISEQQYHLLKSRSYEVDAALKNVEVVKYIKRPSVDASYQANIATANNLTGMFYPVGLLPMTGPPSAKNDYNPVTGSAASILLNWQAVTFGQQQAQINTSIAEANSKKLGFEQERFRMDVNVVSKYLDVLLAFDKVNIQEENIKRVEVNLRESRAMSVSGLRPGVDTAFFLSELSKARIEWLNAKKQLETEQWLLAQLMAIDVLPIPTDTAFLHKLPTNGPGADTSFAMHPFIQFAQSQVDVNRARENLLKKSYLPKLTVFGAAFGRGSGIQHDGSSETFDGLRLSRYNYGAGVQLAYPIMKYGEVKRQLRAQSFLSAAAQESFLQSNAEVRTQQHIANTAFVNSLAVANETKQQLESSQYAFDAMQQRYNTGLVSLSDMAQVQYNLLQAELALKIAYWDAWKALLLQAFAQGDVNVFLNEVK